MSVGIAAHPEYLRMDEKTLILQLLADTEDAITYNTHPIKSVCAIALCQSR